MRTKRDWMRRPPLLPDGSWTCIFYILSAFHITWLFYHSAKHLRSQLTSMLMCNYNHFCAPNPRGLYSHNSNHYLTGKSALRREAPRVSGPIGAARSQSAHRTGWSVYESFPPGEREPKGQPADNDCILHSAAAVSLLVMHLFNIQELTHHNKTLETGFHNKEDTHLSWRFWKSRGFINAKKRFLGFWDPFFQSHGSHFVFWPHDNLRGTR